MKKIIFYAIISASLLLIGKSSNAQDYKTAVGAKFGGFENGFALKYFMMDDVALEGVLGFREHWVVLTGLYEIHQEAFGVNELKFYYGAGAHVGAGNGNYPTLAGSSQDYKNNHILIGVDGVLGLEYSIPQAPIAVSVDLNPRAELGVGPFFDIAPGIGVKYTF